jgi:hypothetical protein
MPHWPLHSLVNEARTDDPPGAIEAQCRLGFRQVAEGDNRGAADGDISAARRRT